MSRHPPAVTPGPPDTPLVQAFCEAAREGDARKVLALFSESLDADVVLHQGSRVPDGGLFRGREQVLAAVEQAEQFVDITRVEIERIGTDGDCVVVFLHSRWRAEAFTGRGVPPPPDMPMAQVWRFRRGCIVEIRPFPFHQPTIPLP